MFHQTYNPSIGQPDMMVSSSQQSVFPSTASDTHTYLAPGRRGSYPASRETSPSPGHTDTDRGSRRASAAQNLHIQTRFDDHVEPTEVSEVNIPAVVTFTVPQGVSIPSSPAQQQWNGSVAASPTQHLSPKWINNGPDARRMQSPSSPTFLHPTVTLQLSQQGIDAPRSAEVASQPLSRSSSAVNFAQGHTRRLSSASSISDRGYQNLERTTSPMGLSTGRSGSVIMIGDEYGPLTNPQAAEDVRLLHNALKGVDGHGVDNKTIITIVGCRTPDQAAQIAQSYKASYGINLADECRKHLSSNFGKLCVALTTPLPEFDAECLHEAMSGLGTSEDVLIETLIGRSNAEINSIKEAYFNKYMRVLEKEIVSETSSHLRKLLVATIQAQRDESEQTYDVERDVEVLFQESRKSWWKGRDESVFIATLCGRSDAHLLQVFDMYQRKHGSTVEQLVQNQTGGDLGRGLMCLVHSVQNRPAHVATLIESSLHAVIGIHDGALIRLTARYRDPRVMRLVRDAYEHVYGKSLYRRVEDMTSGDYKRLLLLCIGLD
ncbi:hypothetical protein DFS34DRAFT_633773 [Phlyctochytrium arcticum]|nr:hypothetical protein DFS34DRAFT_633773 [Phlyctochytrium arcticum]